MAIVYPPPAWTNQDLVLYHGTTLSAARSILDRGIDIGFSRFGTDLGRGFYTTTIRTQAQRWASRTADRRRIKDPSDRGVVIEIVMQREEIARLTSLTFIDGSSHAEHFWRFVHYCRLGASDHGRLISAAFGYGFYDVVYGPVAAIWDENLIKRSSDQISFHTEEAQDVLNRKGERQIIEI